MFDLDAFIIKRTSKYIGKDPFGNQYYQKKNVKQKLDKRYVIYQGLKEGSKVPALWHAWLHYISDEIPTDDAITTHLPNLTGTKHAYLPKGHILNQGKREKVLNDYQAWTPEENKL